MEIKLDTYYVNKIDCDIIRVLRFYNSMVVFEVIKDIGNTWNLKGSNIKSFTQNYFYKYYKYFPAYNSPLYKAING